jgi:hypothetical protein
MGRKYPPNRGGPPPKHGVRQLTRLIKENALDRRTKPARLLQTVANDLAADAGGWQYLTHRERLLIRNLAAVSVVVQTIEGYALQDNPLPDGQLLPVLARNYLGYCNTLRLGLAELGLRPARPEKDVTLQDYLRAREAGTEAEK